MKFIPYIGSKRKLSPHILLAIGEQDKVLDLFSGSGVIAYQLRSKGITVHANDTASYSYYINTAYLTIEPVPFFDDLFFSLNQLTAPKEEYFAKYYSQNPEASKERIYYTRENGLFIDAVLETIWLDTNKVVRPIILCDLLYKMTKHANTSGIFKSWHKKFAGGERFEGVWKRVYKSNKKKILSRIQLEKPIFPSGPIGKVFQYDAQELFEKIDDFYDAIYIDPPYNTHQYSANYHLLEQACRPLEARYIPNDSQISGIQPDLYKSPYCGKKTYYKTFCNLFNTIKGRTKKIVLSYNSKGHMSPENMKKLMEEKFGNVTVQEIDYFNYRGGKQSKSPVKELIFTAIT